MHTIEEGLLERRKNPNRLLTVKTLIISGYLLILLAVIGLGWFAAGNMERMQDIAKDLYLHPFTVSNAASDLKVSLFELRNHMLQVSLRKDMRNDIVQLHLEEFSLNKTIRVDLAVIKTNFLGDKLNVMSLESNLDQWDLIRIKILAAADKNDFETVDQLVNGEGSRKFMEILPLIDSIQEYALERGKRYVEEVDEHSTLMAARMKILIGLAVVFIFATGFAVYTRVVYLHKKLNRQATTDFLTGIPNRWFFMDLADREIARSHRYGEPFVLAIVDLDLFKTINDKYGHQVGDKVLKKFAAICIATLRDTDSVGRIGGEEFAFLLPKTRLPEGQEIVERVRKSIEETRMDVLQDAPLSFTASFGLAAYPTGNDDFTQLFKRADDALYQAKNSGRNKVCIT